MYDKTITLFNQYESKTTGEVTWYPHVLSGVDLIADRAAIQAKYGAESSDSVKLHIRHQMQDGSIVIPDSSGIMLLWMKEKAWEAQTNEGLANSIRISPKDFFWQGEWDKGPVNDADYQDRRYEGFYAYMNANKDGVYKITSVSDPYTVIPHFEIMGK